MDETKLPSRRASGWAIALASVLAAMLLTITFVQGLSAQGSVEDGTPTATPVEPIDDGDQPTGVPAQTELLTPTIEATPGVSLSITATSPAEVVTTVVVAANDVVTPLAYFPIMRMPLPPLDIDGTRPNSSNQWQIQWEDFGQGYTYRIQESQRPDFSVLTLNESLPGTTKEISHVASPFNTYYYRVRQEGHNQVGPWSSTLAISGAYHDDFSDPNTGWAMRRTTFLEETAAWYGDGDNAGSFIIVVADRWDWMIASPLQAAPEPPYVVEYRARVHDASNLVSGGTVFGGDWNFDDCPEFGNVYQTDNCFNHFYNFNYIHYGAMKLLFEQVDELLWCPGCGGSPIKRLGDKSNWREIDPIFGNSSARDWHTYRVEVRNDGLYLSIDGEFEGQFGSPAYVNDPFFGVFASTDEYKPSIWFYDYFTVTPLDS